MPKNHPTRGATAAVLTAACLWGIGNAINKMIGLSGLSVAFYRMWMGVLAMWIVLIASGERFRWHLLKANWLAGTLFVGQVAFFFVAIRHTSVANASVIAATQPLLIMWISHVRHGERNQLIDLVLALIAIAGITVMVAGSSSSLVTSPKGDLLAAGTLILGAFYVLKSKKARLEFSATEYMMGVTLSGAILITPVALLGASDIGEISWPDFGWLSVIVILVGTSGHLLFTWGLGTLPASRSSQIALVMPVSGTIASYFILDETISLGQLGGIAIAVGALVLLIRRTAN